MAGLYFLAGVNHFLHPEFYKKIMPPWLPWHYELIVVSGVSELLIGIFLIPIKTRKYAAWSLILLLVAVFPANIQMMINYKDQNNSQLWIAIVRLPVQILLIWWAWIYTKQDKMLE